MVFNGSMDSHWRLLPVLDNLTENEKNIKKKTKLKSDYLDSLFEGAAEQKSTSTISTELRLNHDPV